MLRGRILTSDVLANSMLEPTSDKSTATMPPNSDHVNIFSTDPPLCKIAILFIIMENFREKAIEIMTPVYFFFILYGDPPILL